MSTLRSKMKMFVSPVAALAMVVSGFAAFAAAPANAAGRTLTIHYHRTAGDYTGWNLWTWNDVTTAGQAYFTADDAFGKVAVLDVKADGVSAGFLFRSTEDWGTAVKDEANGNGDRNATLVDGPLTEIWMLQGDATAYTSDPSIIVKTDQTIRSFTKKTVKAGKWVTFPMLTTDGTKVKWKSLTPGKCKVVGRNRIVGVSAGLCKLTATAPGAATLNPMAAFPYSITVKK